MDYTAHKVNKLIFEGFLNGDRESLTLNTLQNFFNETIENFSEKWILILDDQYNCDDFSVPATHRRSGHKYCVLMDYKTKSLYKIGIPNPKDITSLESRRKSIIIYQRRSFLYNEIGIVFQKYLKNNEGSYIVSDLKYILIHTFSSLFEQEKSDYFRSIKTQSNSKKFKESFFEVDDVFLSYNIDEESIERDKESVFRKLKGLFEIQSVNRKDILLKDYSNQELILLTDLSSRIFDLMRAINEYIRGDASVYLTWDNVGGPFRFQNFNSTLLKVFKDTTITEDTLKLVKERISGKIEEIKGNSSLRRKIDSGSGFKSYEFRLKEFLVKLQVTTKAVFSLTVSQIGKFVKKHCRNFIVLIKKPWFHIPLAYVILSILSAFFEAWFNGNIKLSDVWSTLSTFFSNLVQW